MTYLRPASVPQRRWYSKKGGEVEAETESFEQVRKRAQIRKHGEAMKAKIEEDAMDPLLRKAYQEIEDEDRMAQGLPPIHRGGIGKTSSTGSGNKASKQKTTSRHKKR